MRAQRIVDMIVGSERYNNTSAFSDRIYRDEPILRTGAEAFGANARREAQPRSRKAWSPMPAPYRKMRALARKHTGWGYSYSAGGAQLFYEQGKLMEDFTDDYEGRVDFAMYFPTYEEMSDDQLRSYFGWRTRLRAGETPEAPTSFLFVHAYEIICGIGVVPGEEGYAELQRFRTRYAGTSAVFDAHLARWSHDYVVYHGLDASLLAAQSETFPVDAVCTLRTVEEKLLARGTQVAWPEHPSEGWPTADELLDALIRLSRYRADRSRFFRDHREDVAEVCARVFARMVEHCSKRRKTNLVDGLFGVPTRVSYAMFPSALFWAPQLHEDAAYEASDAESYVCERGFWWRVLPCRRTETNRELGALLHAIDARMRTAFGDAHPLKEKSLPKYQGKIVDAEIAALVERRAAEEAARVRIDRSALGRIRSAHERTREALLTDDERDDVPTSAQAPTDVPTAMAYEPPAVAVPTVAEDDNPLGLSDDQYALLCALLDGAGLPQGSGEAFLSLTIDAINEAFLDVVGDTVIELDGEVPMLVEDYEQDVREAILAN